MGLGELLVGGVVGGASLLQRLFWLPNRNSHLAWAIFSDLEDRVVAEPMSDCLKCGLFQSLALLLAPLSRVDHHPPGRDGLQRGLQLSQTRAAARQNRRGLRVTRAVHFTETASVTTDVTAEGGRSNCNG